MSLILILGPMMSGKSTLMYRLLDIEISLINKDQKIALIRPKIDTRENITHSAFLKTSFESNSVVKLTLDKLDDTKQFSSYSSIYIDEAQFFTNLDFFIKNLLLMKKNIIICGLSGDYKQEKFGELIDLIPIADKIIHVKAKCKKCYEQTGKQVDAPFTIRTSIASSSKDQIVIGGTDIYEPVCRNHL